MKNEKIKDIIAISIYILTFLLIYFILTKDGNFFASTTDFKTQHYMIPEYFRQLFYDTKDFLPDFALNLGSGSNIYYFSYYGLLNPIVLISYLFPNIPMLNYLITATCITTLSAIILFYFFLKKHKFNYKTRFITAFLFLTAAPIIFHTHRHIMFVNYLPFLILGLFGIDRCFEKKNITLLVISVTLIVLTSYYFSISSLIVLFIYYIYRFIKEKRNNFIKTSIKMSIPFILGIMISAYLTIPTLYALLNGRNDNSEVINFLELFKPSNYLLYGNYELGFTLITLIGILYILIFNKKKENKFLAGISLLVGTIPLFNYILNLGLYINAKTLIPFVPLVLLVTAEFLSILFKNKLNIKQILLITYIITSSTYICIRINQNDELIKLKDINNKKYKTTIELINNITKNDNSFYRINNQVYKKEMMNKVNNIDEYKTTMYSSTYNNIYRDFYYNLLNNNNGLRNNLMISASDNLISQILLNEKYIITKNELNDNYKLINEKNGIKVYENLNVLPIGYATDNLIDEENYKKLNYPTNILTLLDTVVTEKDNTKEDIKNIKPVKIDYKIIDKKNLDIKISNNQIIMLADKDASITVKLNNNIKNKLMFLDFKNRYNPNYDLSITINDQINKLTDETWRYHNNNFTFHYFFYNTDTLEIKLTRGHYMLTDFHLYLVELNKNDKIDEFIIDKNKTKGDIIQGNINVTNDSYFNLCIPYDKGFKIYVDGKQQEYEKTNLSFIGFKINKGNHNIKITYEAPYKKASIVISIIGIISTIGLSIYTKRDSMN